MKNKNLHRMGFGIKRIIRNKLLILIPIVYLIIIAMLTDIGRKFLYTLDKPFSSELFEWLFVIFMLEVAIIGLMLIFTALGKPKSSKKIENELTETGFVDKTGESPLLISKVKHNNIIIFKFYSTKLPIFEYEKHRAEIETALNIKIESIDPGKDMQHVIIKAVASGKPVPQIIMWDDSYLDKTDFVLKIGESYLGDESFNLAEIPHALIGGGSGSGKSKLLKLVLMQSIKKGAVVYLADFKGGVDYPKIWHKKCSIITTTDKLLEKLTDILSIMEERRNRFVQAGTSNISEYNLKTVSNMRRIIVACDEVAEVLDKTGLDKDEKALISRIESKFSKIARQGRAFGIHLLFATQRPDGDILKGQIKNNIGYRVCGRADKILSQIILDNPDGADKILPNDQGMFLTNTGTLFKAYYIDDGSLEGVNVDG